MKIAAIGVGLIGVLSAAISSFQAPRSTILLITGDFQGYLKPCGCTTPQLGGVRRQATLLRDLRRNSEVVWVSNGALVTGNKPQDVLKANMLAETLGALGATAINLSPEDAHLGIGGLLSIQNLSDHKLISSNLRPSDAVPIESVAEAQGMLIGGISAHPENLSKQVGSQPISTEDAVKRILEDAKERSEAPILLFNGTESEAASLARSFPELRLIVYRSPSDPTDQPIMEGQTLLVTPGEYGKKVVRLTFDGKSFSNYEVLPLTESLADDAQVSRFYKSYLSMVDRAGLLDKEERLPSDPFAGTTTCGKCHSSALHTWEGSHHHVALADLEKTGNEKDPDCVKCHVVGLNSIGGFRSRAATPQLANVGCESCHGAGAKHSRLPKKIKMPKIGTQMCIRCHTTDQSPNFNALTAWKLIQHH